MQPATAYQPTHPPSTDSPPATNTPNHKEPATPPPQVHLNKPDKTILVQLIRNVCSVAVAPRYKELYKYNVRVAADAEDEPKGDKQQQGAKDQEGEGEGEGEEKQEGAEEEEQAEEGDKEGAAAAEGEAS